MATEIFTDIIERFTELEHFRVVVFGASNTERYMACIHWADVLEVGLRYRFGRKFQLIHSGISGNNTREALARFDQDVAFFKPACVIITFGGNDCNPSPEKWVGYAEFEQNMTTIVNKVRDLGAIPVLQTYYAVDHSEMDPRRADAFDENRLQHTLIIDGSEYPVSRLTEILQSGFTEGEHSFQILVQDTFGDADTLPERHFYVIDTLGGSP